MKTSDVIAPWCTCQTGVSRSLFLFPEYKIKQQFEGRLCFSVISFPSHPASTQPAPVTFSGVSSLQDHRRRWCGAVWSPHAPFIAISAKPIALPGVAGRRSAAVTSYLPTTRRSGSCWSPTGIYKIVYCRTNVGEMIKHSISVCSPEIRGRKKPTY